MIVKLLILFFILLLSYQFVSAISQRGVCAYNSYDMMYVNNAFEGLENMDNSASPSSSPSDTATSTSMPPLGSTAQTQKVITTTSNDPLILAKQNTANINILTNQLNSLQNQVTALYQQQQSLSQNLTQGAPITGTA